MLVSERSTEARRLGLELGRLADDELLRLVEAHPRLLRRPILDLGDQVIVGFSAERYEAALGGRRPRP